MGDTGPNVPLMHLEALRVDVRDEIKRRIEQRDKYSIQLTLALGAIVAFAFSKDGFRMALVAVPLVSIYFTVLVLYSYRIHKVLAGYLRDKIEPLCAAAAQTPSEAEFETWYKTQQTPGIRRTFFLGTLWVTTVLPIAYLIGAQWHDPSDRVVLWILTPSYLAAATLVTAFFWE
jgi:hypothetical protein